MSHPVQALKDEHRLIESKLNELETRVLRSRGEPFPAEFVREMLDYFRRFADGVHHHKEEKILFPLLEQKGVPVDFGPIGVMLREHDAGRRLLALIEEHLPGAGRNDASALAALEGAVAGYVTLLREHIWKEDNVLFPLAEKLVSGEREQQEMQTRMLGVDSAYASAMTGLRS